MNKKFMVVALMAALSTVGYGAINMPEKVVDPTYKEGEEVKVADWIVKDNIDKINKNFENLSKEVVNKADYEELKNTEKELNNKIDKNTSDLQGQINEHNGLLDNLNGRLESMREEGNAMDGAQNESIKTNTEDIESLKTQVSNNTAVSTENSKLIGNLTQEVESVKGDVDFVKGEVERVDGKVTDLQNKVETGFENLQNQVSGNSQALGEMGQDIVALEKENDKQNDRLDAAEDRLDLGERIDGVQNQQIGNLQSQNVTQDKNILDNKNQIAANKAEQDKVNAKQEKNNADQQAAIEANKNAITETNKQVETNKNDIADLRQDFAKYDGRLSGLEKKVDNLDNKMNKGLSLMAAMNAVDFQNVQTGEMALGAGIGHYGNAQSVALGVAYAPVEDLTVNAKYSITAGDPDSFAVGAGATYKFKVGR